MSDLVVDEVIEKVKGLIKTDLLQALEVVEAAIASDPRPEYTILLAAISYNQSNYVDALKLLRPLADSSTVIPDVPELIAVIYCEIGLPNEALYYAKLGAVYPPDYKFTPIFSEHLQTFADAFHKVMERPLYIIAKVMQSRRLHKGARHHLEQHLQFFPTDVEALDLHSEVLADLSLPEEAIELLEHVMAMAGPSATLFSRLGRLLISIGKVEEGMAAHRMAVSRANDALDLWRAYYRDMDYVGVNGPERDTAAEKIAELIAAKAIHSDRPPAQAQQKEILTIGILLANVRSTHQRHLIVKVAEAFDRQQVNVVGFGMGELSSSDNLIMRTAFDRWVVVDDIDDLTLSVIIENEGVDVLLDAQCLWGENLNVSRRRGAPLQLGWLNHIPTLALPGQDGSLEEVLGIADVTYDLPGLLTPLPALSGQPIAFGVDVSGYCINAAAMAAFASVLHKCPNSTLVLRDNGILDNGLVGRILELAAHMAVAHRIDVVTQPHGPSFWAEIDVALAPPNMAETERYAQALRMGVPLVTWADSSCDRIQRSVLGDRIIGAVSLSDYANIAAELSQDIEGLSLLRQEILDCVEDAPAFNPHAFAASIVTAAKNILTTKVEELAV